MKNMIRRFVMMSTLLLVSYVALAQVKAEADSIGTAAVEMAADSAAVGSAADLGDEEDVLVAPVESEGFHQSLKRKFVEGNAGFMSLVALALVLGLAFCLPDALGDQREEVHGGLGRAHRRGED